MSSRRTSSRSGAQKERKYVDNSDQEDVDRGHSEAEAEAEMYDVNAGSDSDALAPRKKARTSTAPAAKPKGKGKGKAKAPFRKPVDSEADVEPRDDVPNAEAYDSDAEASPVQGRAAKRKASSGGRPKKGGSGIDLSQALQDENLEGEETQFSFTQGEAEKWTASAGVEADEKSVGAAAKISSEDQAAVIKSLARFLLFKGTRHVPIARNQCSSEVMKKLHNVVNPGARDYCIQEARTLLQNTFGFETLTSDREEFQERPWHKANTLYITNMLTHDSHLRETIGVEEQAGARGFLLIVLGFIFCQPHKRMAEDSLYKDLNSLDARIPELPSSRGQEVPGLGNVKDVLKTLVDQDYLSAKTNKDYNGEGGVMVEYEMGTRSYVEIGRKEIITFLCQTCNQPVDKSALDEIDKECADSDVAESEAEAEQ